MSKLILSTLKTFLFGLLALGILLFLPAWTLRYWQAWVFILVFLISVNAIGIYLSLQDPALLEKRKKVGPAAETSPVQKIIMSFAVIGIVTLLVICALSIRFGWSFVPWYISLLGDVLVALGLFVNYLVFKENTFGSSTIETSEDQKVISSGLYAHIRHPMYAGVLIMMIGVPLALGSYWGLVVLAIILPGLIWRILDEEKILKKDLSGYADYMQKVRYRLIPKIW
ncbi:isoprenylcysteine carboxylmethyltransferase family protein [bacterium]|nr:isoprenylcysteine carboxylmethyltransferase family protein [bacterium]